MDMPGTASVTVVPTGTALGADIAGAGATPTSWDCLSTRARLC